MRSCQDVVVNVLDGDIRVSESRYNFHFLISTLVTHILWSILY